MLEGQKPIAPERRYKAAGVAKRFPCTFIPEKFTPTQWRLYWLSEHIAKWHNRRSEGHRRPHSGGNALALAGVHGLMERRSGWLLMRGDQKRLG